MAAKIVECRRCINTTVNPEVHINEDGLCDICELYLFGLNESRLRDELRFFKTLPDRSKKWDAMVGLSGGKDSSATLHLTQSLGFRPLAFTFDIGYYPEHEFERAARIAEASGVDYARIRIGEYMHESDRTSYRKTAELYERAPSVDLKRVFLETLVEDKLHNSPRCNHARAFVRTCRLCRHTVIRAYYHEALKRKVSLVILGMNEYAELRSSRGGKPLVSAMRTLNPYDRAQVHIVHLPFLMRRTAEATRKTLEEIGWTKPPGEDFVESNANSCLFARSAEAFARRMLGFHPDTKRLAREVTVGYLTKDQARRALEHVHRSKESVREILERAKIL